MESFNVKYFVNKGCQNPYLLLIWLKVLASNWSNWIVEGFAGASHGVIKYQIFCQVGPRLVGGTGVA